MDTREQILDLVKQADPGNPLSYVHRIVQEFAVEKLNSHILKCNDCEICSGKKSLACGNANATVMIVGESVAEDEANSGLPYVVPLSGKAGELLQETLTELNINPDELFYINAVNCWPTKEVGGVHIRRTPTKKEVENCSVFVTNAIEVVRPRAILLLGGIALNLFESASVTKARGEWISINGIPAMPTYHPGYFQEIAGHKDPEITEMLKWDFKSDVKKTFDFIKEYYPDSNIELGD